MIYTWADHHLFTVQDGAILLGVDHGSLFSIDETTQELLFRLGGKRSLDLAEESDADREILEGLRDARLLVPEGVKQKARPVDIEIGSLPLTTMVLEVAQGCNLRCTYCYAEGGTYGKQTNNMDTDTARAAVRQLIEGSRDQDRLTLVLFGGEPLLNMAAVRAAVDEAETMSQLTGKKVFISLTTNATLLDSEIIDFIHQHKIAVAISLDGPADLQDANRPDAVGGGSYSRIVGQLDDLLQGASAAVAARVTLVPEQWSRIEEVFFHLMDLGFHEVGIAPVSPIRPELLPNAEHEDRLLEGFSSLARVFVAAAKSGRILPFSNLIDLLARLHMGQTKSVSCGAGYGYLAVDVEGKFYLCHRLVGEESFCVGNLSGGPDAGKIGGALKSVTDGKEELCGSCWARTLCAGGCHYENHLRENLMGMNKGSSCSFIRRWFQLGIEVYAEMKNAGLDEMLKKLEKRVKC